MCWFFEDVRLNILWVDLKGFVQPTKFACKKWSLRRLLCTMFFLNFKQQCFGRIAPSLEAASLSDALKIIGTVVESMKWVIPNKIGSDRELLSINSRFCRAC
jgi:hypothetical protein